MYIVCVASNFFIDVKGISDWKCVTTDVPENKRLGIIVDAGKEQLRTRFLLYDIFHSLACVEKSCYLLPHNFISYIH